METKQKILKAIEGLPDDAEVEDALDRLYLLYKVERGLRQADRDKLLSQEEVRKRMAKLAKVRYIPGLCCGRIFDRREGLRC